MLIPKPFSTVFVAMGAPIDIPVDLPRDQMDHYIELVQQAMDRLTAEMEAMARGEALTVEQQISVRSAA